MHRLGYEGPGTLFLGLPDPGGRGTKPTHRHWPFRVGPHLHAKFQPSQSRDHACRSPPCTWTSCWTPGWGQGPDLTIPALTILGVFFNFYFLKFSQKSTIWAAQTSRSTLLTPPPRGWGASGSNIRVDLSRVDVVLHAKFQPVGSNGVAPYSGRTPPHTHTPTHTQTHTPLLCRLNWDV